MRLPNLDPSGGSLKITDVLFEYEGPQVFTASNAGRANFLAMHALPDRKFDRWLFVRISKARIERIKHGRESLRRAFEDVEYGSPMVVRYDGDAISIEFNPQSQELAYLYPAPDSFLEAPDEDEYPPVDTGLAISDAHVGRLAPVADRVRSPLWEANREVIEYFRAHKTPAHVAANITSRPTLDIAFSAGEDRIDYPVKSLGAALTSTQSLFDVLSATDLPDRGPVPVYLREQTKLLAIASYPSSFGLRIEAETGDLLGEGRVNIAVQRFFDVLSTVGAQSAFEEQVRSLPRRAQRHVKSFIASIYRGKTAFSVEAGIPYAESGRKLYLSHRDVSWLYKQLNRTVDDIERTFDTKARLTGVSIKTKFFMLTDDDGAEYSGKIAASAMPKINEKRVNHLHNATLQEIVLINEITSEENYKYILVDIEEVD